MSDFKAKMRQNLFPLGLSPRARWVSLHRSSIPSRLAGFKEPTSNGRERELEGGKGGQMGREGVGEKGEGRSRIPDWGSEKVATLFYIN